VSGEGAVVALFNGAQGDVSVRWKKRDRGELLARAHTLANKVCTLLPGVEDPDPTVAFQYGVVDPIGGQEFLDASERAKAYKRKSVEDPKPGAAELGGAPAVDGDGVPQNNKGLDLVTVAVGIGKQQMEWCAIWMVPDGVDHNQKYRFEVDKIIGSTASQDFKIGEPEAWSPRRPESPLAPDRRSDFWCRSWLPGTCPKTCSAGP
jgi:hypothetical protein